VMALAALGLGISLFALRPVRPASRRA